VDALTIKQRKLLYTVILLLQVIVAVDYLAYIIVGHKRRDDAFLVHREDVYDLYTEMYGVKKPLDYLSSKFSLFVAIIYVRLIHNLI
jgi:hypothetical protein